MKGRRTISPYIKRISIPWHPMKRTHDLLVYEQRTIDQGYRMICGVDEAGRGPLAGPVIAGAVILPRDTYIDGLDDSKKLSPKMRDRLYDIIQNVAVAISVGVSCPDEIDEVNILQATYRAMKRAIKHLEPIADHVLVDGWKIPGLWLDQTNLIGGDALSASIAAASIIAKVTRDRYMTEMDSIYPGYGFAKHKGYCTPEHVTAIKVKGRCLIHRRSFSVPGYAEEQISFTYDGEVV